ncbi:MAG: hypothetical protein C0469_03525, partial [Cyanobacteria bacterium DS2.3.42]|nr:hypothetical protein [Cyanobacteria bacterium DS2.3.42]
MGGGLEFNPYELQPATGQDDAATQARNASLQASEAGLQATDYQRAQYQAGQVEKPYGNNGRAVYGGDVQQTYNPGTQTNPERTTTGNGQWRAVYGGDTG